MLEFEVIKLIRKKVKHDFSFPSEIIKGIGDDSAVLRLKNGLYLFTTDTLVEGTHFLREVDWYSLGWKSLTSNISDISAMGGKPLYALVSIGVNNRNLKHRINRFYSGFKKIANKFSIFLIGGNTVFSQKVVFTTFLIGKPYNNPIYRKGANIGDTIFVTGRFGDAKAGLEILMKGDSSPSTTFLINKFLYPEPKVKEAKLIALNRLATSMIDSSDGLDLSIKQICNESSVGARIYLDRIPFSPALKCWVKDRRRLYNYVLFGGEEFELVFTVEPSKVAKTKKVLPNVTIIGEIIKKREVMYCNKSNNIVAIREKAYSHFLK